MARPALTYRATLRAEAGLLCENPLKGLNQFGIKSVFLSPFNGLALLSPAFSAEHGYPALLNSR
jgi:hypothetical protein